ncbi:MAG: GH3 family domain-containing protein [Bacteriovoracaceae bacterium]
MHKLMSFLVMKGIDSWRKNPQLHQALIFRRMIKQLSRTQFGLDHKLSPDTTVADFQAKVPLYHYEDYEKYIELLKLGKKSVLWPGKMECFCISSGTTSGEKLIPIYNSALYSMIKTTFRSSYVFIAFSKRYDLYKRKIFHLYGLGVIKLINNIKYGYIGHVSNSKVPAFLVRSKYPKPELNNQKTWKDKLRVISEDIVNQDLSVICGTPPWMNNFLEVFKEKHACSFSSQFPHLTLYVHGGCPLENYREEFFRYMGESKTLWTQEIYPASEGFIAFQDQWDEQHKTAQQDLLLNVGENIFFEFLPYANGSYENKRLTVGEVEVGKVYTLVLTTIGCFASYIIGDNVEVTSVKPLRIRFAGRAKQNVNLVNEHMDFRTINMIFHDLKKALPFLMNDFVLFPRVEKGNAFYHWVLSVEDGFLFSPEMLAETTKLLNQISMERNPFYKGWYTGGVLKPEQVQFVYKGAFLEYLQSKKSVGQNKVPNVVLTSSAQAEMLEFFRAHQCLVN